MPKGIRISEEIHRKMEAARIDGMPYRVISERFGVSIATVSRYCESIMPDKKYKPPHECDENSYKNRWARKSGYESFTDYQSKRIEERVKRPENMRMSHLIRDGLERVRARIAPPKFQKGYRWLAKQIGTTHKAAMLYASGAILPRPEIAGKISEVLGISKKSETFREVSEGNESVDDYPILLDDLSVAIRRTVYSDEKNEKEALKKAGENAQRVLNFFGFSDRIIDNVLEPEERDLFYNLEEAGLLVSEREETNLYTGKNWRIHYWILKKERILKLSKSSVEHDVGSEAEEDEIYRDMSNDDWIVGLRNLMLRRPPPPIKTF